MADEQHGLLFQIGQLEIVVVSQTASGRSASGLIQDTQALIVSRHSE